MSSTLHITDTAGGHRYPVLQSLTISRGQAFLLVYSVTRKQTLEKLKPFYELIHEVKGRNLGKYPLVLIGNECDDIYRWELSAADAVAFAMEWNSTYLETSAMMDINVQEMFHLLLNPEEKQPAASAQPTQKKSQMPNIVGKLLGKCIIM